MYSKIFTNPDIYQVYVPLPENPLKNINCYVIKTEDKNLIIDTGFNISACYEALTQGLKELEIDISKTEMFITHLHSDHTGLAASIMNDDSVIYMSKIDYEFMFNDDEEHSWDALYRKFIIEGFPIESIEYLHNSNPSEAYESEKKFNAHLLNDGDKIKIGEYVFEAILTPGHTPGHMCLYLEDKKLMFLGDHVLFDITPNITFWTGVKDSLKDYIESLRKIKNMEIEVSLPAHRGCSKNIYTRIDEIMLHHDERLDECLKIIKEYPGLHSYDIAGKMQWSMRGKKWEDSPTWQKWFAVGETIAHTDFLRNQNKIYRKLENGIYYYYPI